MYKLKKTFQILYKKLFFNENTILYEKFPNNYLFNYIFDFSNLFLIITSLSS